MIVAARSLSYIKPARVREISWEPRSRRQQNSHFSTIAELSMLHREIRHSIHLCGLQFSSYNGPDMGSRIDVDSRFSIAASPNHHAGGFEFYVRSSSKLATPPQSSLTNYQAASVTNYDFLNSSKTACAQRHIRIFLSSWTTAVVYMTKAHGEYLNR